MTDRRLPSFSHKRMKFSTAAPPGEARPTRSYTVRWIKLTFRGIECCFSVERTRSLEKSWIEVWAPLGD